MTDKKKLKLRGPKEQDLQMWILASLGIEQFDLKTRRDNSKYRVSRNTWLAADGRIVLHRNNTGAYKTAAGCYIRFGLGVGGADIVGLAFGVPVALEVKRETEYQTPDQRRWQAEWERAGGVYRVVRAPSDAQAALAEIRQRVAA